MSFEPLADEAPPDASGVWERLAILEQKGAHQAHTIATLRAGLRQALLVIERSAEPAELLAHAWYRRAKQALNVKLDEAADDAYPPCKHCGQPGGH